MKAGKITINENGDVCIPHDVCMSSLEIAALFDVYVQTVKANIKAVIKSGVAKIDTSCPAIVYGETITPDMFGLDMVIAIAFRVDSPKAYFFREWVILQLTKRKEPPSTKLFIQLSRKAISN